jgi:outer membrane lipoprotein-sorting protein
MLRIQPGRATWISLVVVGLFAIGPARGQPAQLPSGESLMDNYVRATGGKEAQEKIRSFTAKGMLIFGGLGLKGNLIIYVRQPNLRRTVVEIMNIGKIEEGSDGKYNWQMDPIMGAKLKDSSDDDLSSGLDIGDVDWRKTYKSATTQGQEKVNGKDTYKVKLEAKKGGSETRYFDKTTGYCVRLKKAAKSDLGNLNVDMDIGEYKKVGDIVCPHLLTINMLGQKVEMKLTEIKLNVDLPDSQFTPPDAVKELIKKKQGSQPKESGK